ncbi:TIGR01777 family oxidoreductase [Opitutaceae bacterium]|nr:TIGR01777 family oxidoreductase [Opitutaceae bacterium]
MAEKFIRQVQVPQSPAEAFAWHARPGALERLTPPWESVELESMTGGLKDGAVVKMRSQVGPFNLQWVAEHFGYRENTLFCDRQLSGPFARWEHRHRFESLPDGGCRLVDEVDYKLPLAPFSNIARGMVRRRLNRMFDYRHAVMSADLITARESKGRVLVSGASGFIGRALKAFLQTQGWTVDRLVRRSPRGDNEILWSPQDGDVDWPADYSCDAVIHLAGANIAGGRWTQSRMKEIRTSRIIGTQTLVKALAKLAVPPGVFIGGSATGFYGETGDSVRTEADVAGTGFLAEVCAEWEQAAREAEQMGCRVVQLRTGVVLSPEGGALGKMLPAFLAGLGGPIGDGQQWMGWVGLPDWVRACQFALEESKLVGPVNLTAPEPVRQKVFARILGEVISRPAIMPLPVALLKIGLGQMAEETLLANSRVEPTKLTEIGFKFLHPSLEKTLGHVLGKSVPA